jgi:hypothetical protein
VQALMHDDYGAAPRVVEARSDHAVIGLLHALALGSRARVMSRKRIVDDDDVEAPPGHPGIERGGVATAAPTGFEVHRAGPVRAEPRLGEDVGIPIRGDETQRPEGEVTRETLAVRDNRDAKPWIPAQEPGREHDGGQDRFQVTRRQVDDETAIAFGRDVVQSFGQELDIIDDEQPITRIDVAKGALEKGEKIRTERRAERVPIVVRIGHDDCPGLGAREPTQGPMHCGLCAGRVPPREEAL